MKKYEQNLRDWWEAIKYANGYIIGTSEGEGIGKEKGKEYLEK